ELEPECRPDDREALVFFSGDPLLLCLTRVVAVALEFRLFAIHNGHQNVTSTHLASCGIYRTRRLDKEVACDSPVLGKDIGCFDNRVGLPKFRELFGSADVESCRARVHADSVTSSFKRIPYGRPETAGSNDDCSHLAPRFPSPH